MVRVDHLNLNLRIQIQSFLFDFEFLHSNNAMSLWAKIKGKSTDFKNPNAIGQVQIRMLFF